MKRLQKNATCRVYRVALIHPTERLQWPVWLASSSSQFDSSLDLYYPKLNQYAIGCASEPREPSLLICPVLHIRYF